MTTHAENFAPPLVAATPDAPAPRSGRSPVPIAIALLLSAAAITLFLVMRKSPVVAPPETKGITVGKDHVVLGESAPQWKYVQLEVASVAPPLDPLPVTGRVLADESRNAAVATPFAGRVEQLKVHLGDRVKAGDRIALIRAGALADADREIDAAEGWKAARQATLDRLERLVADDAAPRRDLDEARAALREAAANLHAAEARRAALNVSGRNGTSAWVLAPRAGTIVELAAEVGDMVGPEAPRLAQVSALEEVLVVADVQERDVRDLRVGSVAQVRNAAGELRPARVERVSEVLDPERRTVQVRLRLQNRDRAFRPNAFVDVTLPAPDATPRIQLPAAAVVSDGSHPVVFVAAGDGRLQRRPVTLGRTRDGRQELLAGVEVGEHVVTTGALLLQNELDIAE